MNEENKVEYVVIDLPPEAVEWLERALQWPEDLEAYDRLNTPISLEKFCGFWIG
jgi:hypothetical protein